MKRYILALVLTAMASAASAATWYCRPAAAEYGAEDGTSFDNAFDSFADIAWASISPGDTIYFSGDFVYPGDYTSAIGLSTGTSGTLEAPIILDGNDGVHPQARILGARFKAAASFAVYDTTSTTYRASESFGNGFVALGTDPSTAQYLYPATSAADCVSKDGSAYRGGGYLYVNVPDGYSIADCWYNWAGTPITLAGDSYIIVRDFKVFFAAGNTGLITVNSGATQTTGSQIINCELGMAQYTGINAAGNTDNVLVQDVLIKNAPTGTYCQATASNYRYYGWTLERVEVTRGSAGVGNAAVATAADRQALGGQLCYDWTIKDCYVHDWDGDGIGYYPGLRTVAERCLIINLSDPDGAYHHYGWFISGNNSADYETNTAGNVLRNSIIANLGVGAAGVAQGDGAAVRLKGKSNPDIYNNVFYNCQAGMWNGLVSGYDDGLAINGKNNLFLSNVYHYYLLDSAAGNASTLDYNLYWPDTGDGLGTFRWEGANSTDFAGWKTDTSQDAHSVLGDPTLTGAGTYDEDDDFIPLAGSPALSAGTNVGLSADYFGNAYASIPNIGIYGLALPGHKASPSGWQLGLHNPF